MLTDGIIHVGSYEDDVKAWRASRACIALDGATSSASPRVKHEREGSRSEPTDKRRPRTDRGISRDRSVAQTPRLSLTK